MHKWAQNEDPMKDVAKRRLDLLPDSVTNHGLRVPLPFTDRVYYKQDFTDAQINNAIRQAPIKTVPIKGLRAIQHSVQRDRVRQYIDNPNLAEGKRSDADTPADFPVVIQYRGDRYIHDGHHRIVADKLQGIKSAAVRLVKLDSANHDRLASRP